MRTVVLVLAGGRGNRFWPESLPELPKQFLTLNNSKTLLQLTIDRARKLVNLNDIYVIAPKAYQDIISLQLPEIKHENMIIEPLAKDTAAAIGYASLFIKERYAGDPAVVILPADHFIKTEEPWVQIIRQAVQLVPKSEIVTIGITPTRPETGYGYLVLGAGIPAQEVPAYIVRQFIEKPGPGMAMSLVRSRRTLWNSGMLVGRLSALRLLLKKHLPETDQVMEQIAALRKSKLCSSELEAKTTELFSTLRPVSIDFGVLEKSKKIIVVKGNFVWDDMGDWKAIARQETIAEEHVFLLDSSNCVIRWDRGPAVIIGLKNTVVVGTDNGLLVCPFDRLDELKKALNSSEFFRSQAMSNRNRQDKDQKSGDLLAKPWGREIIWARTKNYLAKVLVINPGEATSLQLHKEKEETFYVESGHGFIFLGGRAVSLEPGKVVHVTPGSSHRVVAITELRLFEVSTNHPGDVVRLADRYGRENSPRRGEK